MNDIPPPETYYTANFVKCTDEEFINLDVVTSIDIYNSNGKWWIRFHKNCLYKHYMQAFETKEEAEFFLINLFGK